MALHARPSDLAGLSGSSYEAFCFDQAVLYAGSTIQQQLDAVETGKGKNAGKVRAAKQKVLLERILYGEAKTKKGRFADPADMMSNTKKGGD